MWRFLVLTVVVVMTGAALADDARQLRLEAGALIQAAEVAATARERRALLEEAHGKLLEIRERWSSVSVRVTLYLGGRRVSLSPEDVAAMVAAAPSADLDIGNLREVLGRMPSPVAVDENGWTDLHWAAALNLPELAKALLDAGSDVAAPIKADGEPLSERLQQSLRELDLWPKLTRRGYLPLHIAAFNGAWESVTLLIARGANIQAKASHNGWAPLHSAAVGNALEVAELLIARGADVHAKSKYGNTLLHAAAFGNALEVAELLITRGADIHAKNDYGNTPLHAAAFGNALEVAELLIALGADVQAKASHDGWTPLHSAADGNALEVAELLITRGADIHAKDRDGKTPLHMTAERGSSEVAVVLKKAVRELLEKENLLPMVRVEGGNFTMGCQSGRDRDCFDSEKPAHRVRVNSFEIGQYEVTQELWQAVMGDNPSHFGGCPECPVEQVSWDGVQVFLRKLNQLTGKRYRLPTEAEWEYAARGGRQSRGYRYAGSDDFDSVAWHEGNSGAKTRPVGQKVPNELGLHDMSGNVEEWVQDCWNNGYQGAPSNGSAWEQGDCSRRVVRGGSWDSFPRNLRSANRNLYVSGYRVNDLGFRVTRTLTP